MPTRWPSSRRLSRAAPEPAPAASVTARIRRLQPADLGAYKALRDEALRLHPEAFTSDHETESARAPESYLGRLGLGEPLGGSFLLGAFVEENGIERLVGSVGLERETRTKTRHIAWLIAMMVLPDYTGRGIGRALLDGCLAEARRADGLRMIVLSVTASSERVVRLYERAGFERYGLVPRAVRIVDGRTERFFDKAQMLLML